MAVTLLGMKLNSEHCSARDSSSKHSSIIRGRKCRVDIVRLDLVGMHKIEPRLGVETLRQRHLSADGDWAPTHVWHLELCVILLIETRASAGDPAKPGTTSLIASVR